MPWRPDRTGPDRPRPSSRESAEALGMPVSDGHPDYFHHPTMTALCGFVPRPHVGQPDLGLLTPRQSL